MVETINKLVREQRNLLQELGQDPTPEQIAERMDMTPDKVRGDSLKIGSGASFCWKHLSVRKR